jgi:hypothetical protein
MTERPKDRGDADRDETAEEGHIRPEPLEAEEPAAGVDDVIEVFDREPPERPVSDAEAPPPFG